MHSIREIVESVMGSMLPVQPPLDLLTASNYRRRAIVEYAEALRLSPVRSVEINEMAFKVASEYARKAVSMGVPQERMDASLRLVSDFWIPRLSKDSAAMVLYDLL